MHACKQVVGGWLGIHVCMHRNPPTHPPKHPNTQTHKRTNTPTHIHTNAEWVSGWVGGWVGESVEGERKRDTEREHGGLSSHYAHTHAHVLGQDHLKPEVSIIPIKNRVTVTWKDGMKKGRASLDMTGNFSLLYSIGGQKCPAQTISNACCCGFVPSGDACIDPQIAKICDIVKAKTNLTANDKLLSSEIEIGSSINVEIDKSLEATSKELELVRSGLINGCYSLDSLQARTLSEALGDRCR